MQLKEISLTELPSLKVLKSQFSVFHQTEFLNLYLPHIHIIGIFNDNNDLIGLFYYFKKNKYFIKYIIPPPFHPFNGLVFYIEARKEESKNSIIKELHQHIHQYFTEKENAHYIRFVLPPEYIDTQVFQWNQWKVGVHYTYHLNLNYTAKELFENLSSEKRKSIRKAEKDNVIIKEEKDFEIVRTLVLKTFERQNKKFNVFYLNKILHHWANETNSFAFVAYYQNVPIATSFCVYDNRKAYYLFGGYDNIHAHHGAGVSCMWQSILKSKSLGLSVFDFEGSMIQNVEKYFREFGGTLTPYYVCEKWRVI